MNTNRIEKIRHLLRSYIDYDEDKRLRMKLKNITDKTYTQKYSDKEQIDFLNRHEHSIRIVYAQSINHPYYLELFTVVTQHIYADNIRQILDKAIDIERERFLNARNRL